MGSTGIQLNLDWDLSRLQRFLCLNKCIENFKPCSDLGFTDILHVWYKFLRKYLGLCLRLAGVHQINSLVFGMYL